MSKIEILTLDVIVEDDMEAHGPLMLRKWGVGGVGYSASALGATFTLCIFNVSFWRFTFFVSYFTLLSNMLSVSTWKAGLFAEFFFYARNGYKDGSPGIIFSTIMSKFIKPITDFFCE